MPSQAWVSLLETVSRWEELRLPSDTYIARLARKYAESEEYVRLLFEERIALIRIAALRLRPSEQRFLDTFGELCTDRKLARALRRPLWAARELKANGSLKPKKRQR